MSKSNETQTEIVNELSLAQQKLQVLNDYLGTASMVEMQKYLDTMFHFAVISPAAENQKDRSDMVYVYRGLHHFFNEIIPFCDFDKKEK